MVILSSFEYLLHASPIMKPIIYLALKPIPIKYFHKYIYFVIKYKCVKIYRVLKKKDMFLFDTISLGFDLPEVE